MGWNNQLVFRDTSSLSSESKFTKEALQHEWLHMDPLNDAPGDALLPTISEGKQQLGGTCWDLVVDII